VFGAIALAMIFTTTPLARPLPARPGAGGKCCLSRRGASGRRDRESRIHFAAYWRVVRCASGSVARSRDP
jgi:hypothetical protein